jgi:hypothetical protein
MKTFNATTIARIFTNVKTETHNLFSISGGSWQYPARTLLEGWSPATLLNRSVVLRIGLEGKNTASVFGKPKRYPVSAR